MKKAIIALGASAVLLFGVWLFGPTADKDQPTNGTDITLQDAHGLAVNREDPQKVYIATHSGLLIMGSDGKLQRVGTARDDYMGFSAHPTDPNTFYTSGHPHSGGNLGFQKSTDGGQTWQKVANGINGPVDFHSMSVGQADPSLVYGVYRGQLQRSKDEGKTWELVNHGIGNITALATSAKAADVVYAGTTGGLYQSQDNGQTWSKLPVNGVVMAIAVSPADDQVMVTSVQGQGLMKSTDGGSTWVKLAGYAGDAAMHLAYSPQTPSTVYLINKGLEVHKTADRGETWQKIR